MHPFVFGLDLRRATRSTRTIRGSGFERVKFILAHHPAELPEGEEGNEGAEYDDRPADQIIEIDIMHDSSSRPTVNEALDETPSAMRDLNQEASRA